MDISNIVDATPEESLKEILKYLLESYTTPAFGALPKNEIELIFLNALEKLGAISPEPEVYELVSKLRVTRSKSRNLIYERELRKSSEAELDLKVKTILRKPLILKNGKEYKLEVENPLVSDHLKYKVQKLGYISDGSFSPSIVTLGVDSIAALIDLYLTDGEKEQTRVALIAAGAPDTSFKGVLKATLGKIANKVASDTGEELMNNVTEFLGPIVDAGIDQITERIPQLFNNEG